MTKSAKSNGAGASFWAPESAFSSKSDDWPTPPEFFAVLDAEFRFELDVCASAENAKCPTFFTPADDGLSRAWRGICWMNPPYGRDIGRWLEKAYESSRAGATVVCLVPARTDIAWWHDWAMRADEIRLVRGRLRFGSGDGCAPFPSAVVVFRRSRRNSPRVVAMTRPPRPLVSNKRRGR